MQRISLEIYTTSAEAVRILTDIADHKIEMDIPVGSVLLDNILNLKLIKSHAEKNGKDVSFTTDDEYGKNLIAILNGEEDGSLYTDTALAEPALVLNKRKFKFPVLRLPKPSFKSTSKLKWVVLVVPFVVIIGAVLFLSRTHKADIALYFEPRTLTKSVAVKVKDGSKVDLEQKVLGGLKIAGSAAHSMTVDATGVELEGEKAKGKVTLYNSTLDEINVKKGTQLTYKNKDKLYVFTAASEVDVPARIDAPAPDTTITKGTAEVSVIAEEIGLDFNIKKGKELSVKNYKSSELAASSSEDFKGGSSKEVKVVTQEDLTKLEQELVAFVLNTSSTSLQQRIPSGFVLIDKSEKNVENEILIDGKIGDKKDQLGGSITAQFEALTYSKNELVDFMGKLSENLVPTGFEYYSYNKEVNVEVLGNTESTVLSPTEADLQVTFKFYIIPKLNKQDIFNQISGKNLDEAVKYLGAINDVKTVELNVFPSIPIFSKIPSRFDNVDIQLKVIE